MKIIEATLLMPLTCLITISLITLMMYMYNQFLTQIQSHDEAREKMYQTSEVVSIRVYDKFYEELSK